MTQEEIVKALRNSCHDCNPTPCCEYEVLGIEAADLIESLTERAERAGAAVSKMAEYIVAVGRCDCYLCDDVPIELHLKYQPKNDGNYDNEPCAKCIAEYFMRGARKEREMVNETHSSHN